MAVLLLSILLFLQLCSGSLFAGDAERHLRLTILQTTDIHCHVTGHGGNWLRLATLIRRAREQAGSGNCLLIDCGDTIAGSCAAALTNGNIAVQLLNFLHYDVWVPGNHDYDFGLKTLLRCRRRVTATMLAANLKLENDKFPPFTAWKMFHRGGLKIAVIGLSLPESEKSYWPAPSFQVLPGMAVLARVMREIRAAKPHIIVLAAHCGLYSADRMLQQIARHYPEIDLFLGGHTHLALPGERIASRGWYVQAGKYAEGLAKIEILFSTRQHSIINLTSKIVPTSEDTPFDPLMTAAIARELQQIRRREQEKLGIVPASFAASDDRQAAARLIGLAMRQATRSRAALVSVGEDISLVPGTVTRQQAFELYPYLDTICTIMLTGDELINLLREQRQETNAYHHLYPVGIEITTSKFGKTGKIKFSAAGALLKRGQRYKIALSSYACSQIQRLPVSRRLLRQKQSHVTNCGIKVYRAIAEYINRLSPGQPRKRDEGLRRERGR